jgi:hypothetical protein
MKAMRLTLIAALGVFVGLFPARAAGDGIQTQGFVCTGVRYDYNADGVRIGGANVTSSLTLNIVNQHGEGFATGTDRRRNQHRDDRPQDRLLDGAT